jgi:HSP20 family protein
MVVKRRKDDDWDADFFDDFFEDFGFDFEKVNERLRKTMERMIRNTEESHGEPFVYGFSYKVGPDGKPVFQEFGNLPNRPTLNSTRLEGDIREPLTDINYDKDKVYITYELPGISKEDIDLKVSENDVIIDVSKGSRKYYKQLELETPINPDSSKAKFVNGILDLTLDLLKKGGDSGRSVNIE